MGGRSSVLLVSRLCGIPGEGKVRTDYQLAFGEPMKYRS